MHKKRVPKGIGFIDQLAHLLTIGGVVVWIDPGFINLLYPISEKFWLVLTLLVFIATSLNNNQDNHFKMDPCSGR